MVDAVEEFQDFTVATPWEKFVASLEQVLRSWLVSGTKDHVRTIQHQLAFRSEPYSLTFISASPHSLHRFRGQRHAGQPKDQDLQSGPGVRPSMAWVEAVEDKLMRWFDIDKYVILEPNSYSRRILNDQEASTLLSGLATALSTCHINWPAFVPVHDPLRDAYWGIAAAANTTAHFDTDSIHISKNPAHLQKVDGQLGFFAQQVLPYSQVASQACRAAIHSSPEQHQQTQLSLSMLRSYRIPKPITGQEEEDALARSDDPVALWLDDWAIDAPWEKYASHADPVGSLELDLLWAGMTPEEALQNAGDPPLASACSWQVHCLAPGPALSASGFLSSKVKAPREHLSLSQQETSDENVHSTDNDSDSFASMLGNLVQSSNKAAQAKAVGDLASHDWWERRQEVVPASSPPDNLQQVLDDVLDVRQSQGEQDAPMLQSVQHEQPVLSCPKTAPADSLLVRLALHVMCFGNARAIAILWQRFVQLLREGYWERGRLLPRMAGSFSSRQDAAQQQQTMDADEEGRPASSPCRPDFGCCLLHQKLQMLNMCIHSAHRLADVPYVGASSQQSFNASTAYAAPMDIASEPSDMEEYHEASSEVEGMPPNLYLLSDPTMAVNIPVTQEAPPLTEDMVQDRQTALAALGDSESDQAARARLQGGDLLQSDMAAFKAANPACQLADFVRWHSPKDWQPDSNLPQGGHISDRMSHQGNTWQRLWDTTAPEAVSQQRPLFKAEMQAERVFHDLENIPPQALWNQLLALAAVAAASMLSLCPGATLAPSRHCFAQFQNETSSMMEAAGGVWGSQPASHRTSGSPRTRHRARRGSAASFASLDDMVISPSHAQVTKDQMAGSAYGSGTGLVDEQAAQLVTALQHLEQVVVAGESLCRRLPGCQKLAAGLLQAAVQPPLQPSTHNAHLDTTDHSIENSDLHHQQPELQCDRKHGVPVTIDQEKLILDCLMRERTLEYVNSTAGECESCKSWGAFLGTEWVTTCCQTHHTETAAQQKPHRLYVQASPGEMRLATVMTADA